ncbi:NtrZ family periplasmic regulatory protein [uncultured Brevundimonas sp.]|uniref:NtrZ family periplasmic regulatory protein n=1 Tax=uncultured Brevundimonas sp. TaxID=213418 RepID=UPI0030EE467C|tara:strand:- start:2223 stop:2615 length:393 start_codon:yes stop_codon:yes gene_type:complete
MQRYVVIAAVIGGLAVLALADDASAQTTRTRAPVVTLSEAGTARTATTPPRRGLQFNESGRWGLNFNLSQPVGREADWGDVEAGAYYRINPRLRVGAAAGLAAPEADPGRLSETDRRAAPRFRLESIFKF